ncbi:MAG: Fe2+-dependent dioxygenase [Chromatiales bacterium]|nr:Fe2+-dependent dioxygenase [Chromatiales bacterium]
MLLHIPNVLNRNDLEHVHGLLGKARFVDGKLSAGMAAKRVKNNQEVAREETQLLQQLNNVVMGRLVQHPIYLNAALPLRIATPFYARYGQGMTYGDHVDDPVMGPGPGQQYRSDLSITVFLNDPGDYEGGELVVRTSFGDRSIKLPAGDAIMYPSSSIHHVAEITSGERVVAVTWLQSMIRDPQKRELLYELNQAREQLLKSAPEAAETKQVDRSYVNLVRMWSEV